MTSNPPGEFLLCPPLAPAAPRLVALVLWAEPPAAGVAVLRAEPDQLPHPRPVPLLQPHHAPRGVQEAADVGHEGAQLLLRLQQEPHRPLVRRVGESSGLLLVKWKINFDNYWHEKIIVTCSILRWRPRLCAARLLSSWRRICSCMFHICCSFWSFIVSSVLTRTVSRGLLLNNWTWHQM